MKRARSRPMVVTFLALSAALAAGCGDDENPRTAGSSGGNTTSTQLSGMLSYEAVPYNGSNQGLDYSKITTRPIRGARVLLLDAANDAILAETTSGGDGKYVFVKSDAPNVKISVYAETTTPSIVVADNTAQNARYVLESAPIVVDGPKTLDLVAGSGWTGSSYGKPRVSAPFSILDAAYAAASRFIDEGVPKPTFPKLEINWSVENRPEDGDVNLGEISTSHWDGTEIYILGKEDIDTDEFDTHVIVHEWGHSFEQFISRSDSFGGSHGYGDVLDPRLAFSEGFCNALSAIILDPDTVYSDASGMQQNNGFSEDINENDTSAAAVPGWYSETTVQNIVYDLYDNDQGESFDKVNLGVPGIYSAAIGGLKMTPALTTIFPFVNAVKTEQTNMSSAIDAIVTHHSNGSGFGIDPVQDDWGKDETHSGGEQGAIPVYLGIIPGQATLANFAGGLDWALLGQNRFFRFKGTGGTMSVSTTCTEDVDLYVYFRGVEVDSSATTDGNEFVTFSTKAGDDYVINVQGFGQISGLYQAQVDLAQ